MASGSNYGLSNQSMDFGLPPRPPTASTAVWNHLLRLGTTTTTEAPKSLKDIPIIAPPMAPLDKNATSMRVLLHDTQANFEKFTVQVGKLFETIQEAKNDLKTMQSLFQRDRETLTGDIVDLVNRSQREIQKSIGTPTQSDAFENSCKNIHHRLDGLDQRVEAMNAFNQTHSQALQTQMHTVQLILDKQGSILSAVTPLLPYLQGLPPLIEALRGFLTEKLQEVSMSLKNQPRSDTPPISTNKRKRTFVEHNISSLSPSCDNAIKSPGKRSRLMDLSAEAQPSSNGTSKVTDTGQGTSSLLFASSSSPLHLIPASIGTFSGTTAGVRPQEKQTPRRHLNNFAIPPFPPPSYSRRRPSVIDITSSSSTTSSAVPLSSVPTSLFAVRSHTNVSTRETAPKLQGQPNTPSFFGLTPTAARPPPVLRVHTSLAAMPRSNNIASVPETHAVTAASIGNTLKVPDLIDDKKDHPNRPRNVERNLFATQSSGKGTTSKLTAPELTSVVGRLTRSNTRALTALGFPLPPQPSTKEDKKCDVVVGTLTLPRPPQPSLKEDKKAVVHDVKNTLATTDPSDALVKGKHTTRPGKAKRRSPVKEGRRFIPLIDSDDDEEN